MSKSTIEWKTCHPSDYETRHRIDSILAVAADDFGALFAWSFDDGHCPRTSESQRSKYAIDSQHLWIKRWPFVLKIRFDEDIRGDSLSIRSTVAVHSVEVTRE